MIDLLKDANQIANFSILFFLVVTALAVVKSKNLLTATVLMGVFSLLMATEYLILGAADVAITEAAVGAGISTILVLLGLFLIGEKENKVPGYHVVPFIIIAVVTGALIYASGQMPIFGAADSPAQTHIASFYLDHAQTDTGIPNSVTSILASYRGYDTLGETFVIFTAGMAVFMLLGFKKK